MTCMQVEIIVKRGFEAHVDIDDLDEGCMMN